MTAVTKLEGLGTIQIWRVDLSTSPSEESIGTLSAAEVLRASRFAFPRDSRRFLAARCSLRMLLAEQTGIPPRQIRYAEGPFGKPFMPDLASCSFNLSHSGDLALIAISDGVEIGIDIEVDRTIVDAEDLARYNFTPFEFAEFQNANPIERDHVFLLGWTRKEACLKALGVGLSIPPESFEVGLNAATKIVRIETANGDSTIEVRSLINTIGFVGAVARFLPPRQSA